MTEVDPIEQELAQLTGRHVEAWTVEPLLHNKQNAVTGSIARIVLPGWTAVLKVLCANEDALAHWLASDTPSAWNYWLREALVYEHDVPGLFAESGVEGPRLLGIFRRAPGEVALWLEHVAGVPGTDWTIARHATAARSLGVAQGRLADLSQRPEHAWLTRRFLRDYSGTRPGSMELLDDDVAWSRPLVRDHFPPSLRREMVRMHAERERWLGLMESLPRTLCHLDVWPHNMLARDDERTVLVDWSFVGDGAIGEDIGNLIPDVVFDLFMPASSLPELDARVFEAYLDGLREGGWRGDERVVRLATCASAIKYDWLTPLMLERATLEEHVDYGGEQPISPELRYAERGRALLFLAAWLEEARSLADELGL